MTSPLTVCVLVIYINHIVVRKQDDLFGKGPITSICDKPFNCVCNGNIHKPYSGQATIGERSFTSVCDLLEINIVVVS